MTSTTLLREVLIDIDRKVCPMRILITAPIFHNSTRMASQRPRSIAKLLAERGHDVTVITENTEPQFREAPLPGVRVLDPVKYDSAFEPTRELPLWKRIAVNLAVLPTYPSLIINSQRIASLLRLDAARARERVDEIALRRRVTAATVKALLADSKWSRQTTRALAPQISSEPPFDIIFSTYGPLGSLWLGKNLMSGAAARAWVIDLRDPIQSPEALRPIQMFLRHQRDSLIKSADAVTTVSEGIREDLISQRSLSRLRDKCSVITNGFLSRLATRDSHPAPIECPQARQNDLRTLRIAYTGALYRGRRDARPLFEAIKRVTELHPESQVQVTYAGAEGDLLKEIAAHFGLEESVRVHGPVTHQEARLLQEDADILLALTWNDPDYKGVLPGKFLEYLGVDKPVITLVDGLEPDAELTRITNATNIGIAVEASEGSAGIDRLTKYLNHALESKKESGKVPFAPRRSVVAKYDYESITTQIEELFTKITRDRETTIT